MTNESWRPQVAARTSLLDVLEELLAFCAANSSGSNWPGLEQAWRQEIAVFAVAAEGLDLLTTAGTGPDALAQLDQHASPFAVAPAVVSAAAYARAIDHCWSSLLVNDWTRKRSTGVPIKSGELVMFDDTASLNKLLGGALGVGFHRTQEHAAATAHAHLYSPHGSVPPIVFDDALDGPLASCLHDDPLFAACCPNANINELHKKDNAVRPLDEKKHEASCIDSVTDALACGARVIVLPEFSGYLKVTEKLRGLRPHSGHAMVVAGSGHELHSGEKLKNRSLAWISGPDGIHPLPPIEILKRVPYHGSIGTEELDPLGQTVTVYTDGPWRMVIGICRDLLDPDLVSALVSVGVNLVLAPACSAKTLGFGTAGMAITLSGTPATSAYPFTVGVNATPRRRLSS